MFTTQIAREQVSATKVHKHHVGPLQPVRICRKLRQRRVTGLSLLEELTIVSFSHAEEAEEAFYMMTLSHEHGKVIYGAQAWRDLSRMGKSRAGDVNIWSTSHHHDTFPSDPVC